MPHGPADTLLMLAAAMAGGAVFLLAYRAYPRQLLGRIERKREQAKSEAPASVARPSGSRRSHALRSALLEIVGDLCVGLVRPAWAAKMKRHFTALGEPAYRPEDFRAQQLLAALGFFVWGMAFFAMLKKPLFVAIPLLPIGFFFPYWVLRERIRKRHRAIVRAMPYHVDLLTLSVEAGLDFGGAMQTVVDKGQLGPLLEEFGILLKEMKLGKTREEALKNLAERLSLLQMSTFVANIVQADKMGTSMGKVLRIQSGQMRVERRQRAEKLANEAPVKMLFPLVACFFPTVFMVLFGPIIYRLFFGGGLH